MCILCAGNRDYFTVVDGSEDISANLYQMQSSNQTVEETPIPDREATIVISATDGEFQWPPIHLCM